MSAVNLTNPYFTETPFLANVPIKLVAGLTVILAAYACYLMKFKAPPHLSRVFQNLMIYHIIAIGLLPSNIAFTCYPIVMFPYIAFHGKGLFSDLGVPQLIQIQTVLAHLTVALSAVGAIFYYRMDILLPSGQFLNNKPARFVFYTINYVIFSFFPYPVVYLAERQRKITKYDVFMEYRVVFPDIFQSDVIFGVLDSRNPEWYYMMIGFPAAIIYGLFLTIFTNYTMFTILKKHAKTMSDTSKRHHIEVLKALTGLVVCVGVVLIAGATPLVLLIYTNSWRADIFNIVILIVMLCCPSGIASFIFSYRPLRKHVINSLRTRKGPQTQNLSNVVVINSGLHKVY